MKKYLFGWTNIKWAIKEAVKVYSGVPSFFSKKRIESGVAFIMLQCGMAFYITHKIDVMDMYDMGMWAGIEGTISGYMLNQIQREKRDKSAEPPIENE